MPSQWNPFTQYSRSWQMPDEVRGGYNRYGPQKRSWRPDFEGGAGAFYTGLTNEGGEDYDNYWGDYARMLANSVLTRGLMNPAAQNIWHGAVGLYGGTPDRNPNSTPVGDGLAQQYNTRSYWDSLEGALGGYLEDVFGHVDFGAMPEQGNQFTRTNEWLDTLFDQGRNYATGAGDNYWSTYQQSARDNAWELLQGQADSFGINDEIVNLGRDLWNIYGSEGMVGGGPSWYDMNTGAYNRYRNSRLG